MLVIGFLHGLAVSVQVCSVTSLYCCVCVCVMQWMWRSGKIRLRRMNVNWRSWRRMKTSRWRCCYRFFHSLTLSRDASALRTVNMSVLLPSLLWHYRRKITTNHTCVRVPAPALNSRPALKVLEFQKTEKVLELFWKKSGRPWKVWNLSVWLCELPAIVAVKLVEELLRPLY